MAKSKLEYIWLDGYKPTQSLRSKTKIENNFSGKLEDLDMWSFDGSSTQQAEGGSSDCLLKPVYVCPDPARRDGYLVMCEVLNADGTPHESNGRATIDDDDNDGNSGFVRIVAPLPVDGRGVYIQGFYWPKKYKNIGSWLRDRCGYAWRQFGHRSY
jgi:hypothetical protein